MRMPGSGYVLVLAMGMEALEQSDLPPLEFEIENLDLLQFHDESYKEVLKR